jgi:WD40 repeat protein
VGGEELPSGWQLRHTLSGHEIKINSIAWSPVGSRLVSAADDETVRVWDADTGAVEHVLEHGEGYIFDVAVATDGDSVISGSTKSLKLWDIRTGNLRDHIPGFGSLVVPLPDRERVLTCSQDKAVCVIRPSAAAAMRPEFYLQDYEGGYGPFAAVTPDGSRALLQGPAGAIGVYDLTNGARVELLQAGSTPDIATSSASSFARSLCVTPDGRRVIAGCNDSVVYVFDLATGALEATLEAHTEQVTGVDVSPDGTLLVTKGWQERVLLWDLESMDVLSELEESEGSTYVGVTPRFHPTRSDVLATFGEQQLAVRLWRLDLPTIRGQAPHERSVSTATAKIALVGDSGVGKSTLAERIVSGRFEAAESTHGEQFWVVNELAGQRGDGVTCEAVLWDFAGQPDYRLVHALFLDDVDLALVLFDASDQDTPLKGVDYWLEHMQSSPDGTAQVLVAARADRGATALTTAELDAFCAEHDIRGGHVVTSAVTGLGVEALVARVRRVTRWDDLPATTTTPAFKAIRERVLDLKSESLQQPVATWEELGDLLREDGLTDFSETDLQTAVGNLQKHGYVTLLRGSEGESSVLLAPDLLINLASSIVLEARRNPDGLGALEEDRLRHGEYELPELEKLGERDRATLLDGALALFLQRALCFRERLGRQTFLIFPALVRSGRAAPEDPAEAEDDVTYRLSGAVQNVYASLVVLLGYTNTFSRSEHWRDQARYEADGHVCIFRLAAQHKEEVELVLAYSPGAPGHIRSVFQGLVESFLARAAVTVRRYPLAVCGVCGTRQQRVAVVARVDAGRDFIICEECGERIPLAAEAPVPAVVDDSRATVRREDDLSRRRSVFEQELVHLKRLVENLQRPAPSCFISYAWGDPEQEAWVERLANDLDKAGVDVLFDRWESTGIGTKISRFVKRIAKCDFVLVVGTRAYVRKGDNVREGDDELGSIVSAESDLIDNRLTQGTEARKATVLPALLEGDPKTALPELLHGRVFADFRVADRYFDVLLEVLLALFGIANEPAGRRIREEIRGAGPQGPTEAGAAAAV